MTDIAIRVENLSKRYRIGIKDEKQDTLVGTVLGSLRHPLRSLRRLSSLTHFSEADSPDVLWALKDVSFEVPRGEVLGVIGRNGAGKSTLLKILARITYPTYGRVELHGRVASLLEVGTGFHPELTGRENVYLNGTILGMTKPEIDRKFDEIVDFSGVEKFIDTPVKRYSSGMAVRLAFSVAAHLEPEILLVDEVLAVGDAEFQRKCLGKMGEVAREGRTVLFVSHNMGSIRNLCQRGLLIERGNLIKFSTIDEIVDTYFSSIEGCFNNNDLFSRSDRTGSKIYLAKSLIALSENNKNILISGAGAKFILDYVKTSTIQSKLLYVGFFVKDLFDNRIFACTTSMKKQDFINPPHIGQICCEIDWLPLAPGKYSIDLKIMDEKGLSDFLQRAISFEVIDNGSNGFFNYASNTNFIVQHHWSIKDLQ